MFGVGGVFMPSPSRLYTRTALWNRYSCKDRVIKVNSDPSADMGQSHAPVPFNIYTAGYGLFADLLRYITYYMESVADKGMSKAVKQENYY